MAIKGLTENQANAWLAAVRKRESSDNYGAINSKGYVGAYQFGAAALADAGYLVKQPRLKDGTVIKKFGSWRDMLSSDDYIKSGKFKGKVKDSNGKFTKEFIRAIDNERTRIHKEIINNKDNWTGKNNANNVNDFLGNQYVQDKAMEINTNRNYDTLVRNKAISPAMNQANIAGFLTAAHLKGAGGAINLAKGKVETDAYGTPTDAYFRLGHDAVRPIDNTEAMQPPGAADPYSIPVAPPSSPDLATWQEPGAFEIPSSGRQRLQDALRQARQGSRFAQEQQLSDITAGVGDTSVPNVKQVSQRMDSRPAYGGDLTLPRNMPRQQNPFYEYATMEDLLRDKALMNPLLRR